MNKHTPTPWKVSPMNTRPQSYRIIDEAQEGNGSICEIAHVYSLPNAEANARLIAAAPELLEALKLATEELDTLQAADEKIINVCRAVIAKAKG